jgi:hypothetical protein
MSETASHRTHLCSHRSDRQAFPWLIRPVLLLTSGTAPKQYKSEFDSNRPRSDRIRSLTYDSVLQSTVGESS